DLLERMRHRVLDPVPIDLAHREDRHAELAQERALAGVERADADESDARRFDGRQLPAVALERLAAEAERSREHHPVDVPRRARLRSVDVAVRVQPEDAAEAEDTRKTGERAE